MGQKELSIHFQEMGELTDDTGICICVPDRSVHEGSNGIKKE